MPLALRLRLSNNISFCEVDFVLRVAVAGLFLMYWASHIRSVLRAQDIADGRGLSAVLRISYEQNSFLKSVAEVFPENAQSFYTNHFFLDLATPVLALDATVARGRWRRPYQIRDYYRSRKPGRSTSKARRHSISAFESYL